MLPIERSMLTATSEQPVTLTTSVASSLAVVFCPRSSRPVTDVMYELTHGWPSSALGEGRAVASRVRAESTKSCAPAETATGNAFIRLFRMSDMVPCCINMPYIRHGNSERGQPQPCGAVWGFSEAAHATAGKQRPRSSACHCREQSTPCHARARADGRRAPHRR